MFARHVSMHLKANSRAQFTQTIENEILPLLKKQHGFRDEIVFVAPLAATEVVAISLWDKKEDAEAYLRGSYPDVLKALALGQQVICITHLPQIAAFADQHFLIEKTERRGRTQTGVRRMEQSERVEEIARMLSGASLTETSRRHAEQMLAQSR